MADMSVFGAVQVEYMVEIHQTTGHYHQIDNIRVKHDSSHVQTQQSGLHCPCRPVEQYKVRMLDHDCGNNHESRKTAADRPFTSGIVLQILKYFFNKINLQR